MSTSPFISDLAAKPGGYHQLASPRSKHKSPQKSSKPAELSPSSKDSDKRALGLKSPQQPDEHNRLLRAALKGELKDSFQKSILDGAPPGQENVKATEVEKIANADQVMSSALLGQLLNRLAIGRSKTSPPNSPRQRANQGGKSIGTALMMR